MLSVVGGRRDCSLSGCAFSVNQRAKVLFNRVIETYEVVRELCAFDLPVLGSASTLAHMVE